MNDSPALADLTVAQLRARALEYRRTAENEPSPDLTDSMLKLAAEFDALAAQRELIR